MTAARLLGLAIAAVGVFFLAVGIDATHAPLERLSHVALAVAQPQ